MASPPPCGWDRHVGYDIGIGNRHARTVIGDAGIEAHVVNDVIEGVGASARGGSITSKRSPQRLYC